MKTDVVQKAIILNKAGDVLMLRRSKTDVRRPLQWDLPGGMLEEGEELFSSIKREISEETGIKVANIWPVYSKTEVRSWLDGKIKMERNVVYIFYVAQSTTVDVSPSYEHDKFQWCALKKAVEQYEYPLHREVLNYIIKEKLV